MFHLTLFAGTEIDMTPREFTSFTMFGGSDLRLPTLAAQVQLLKNPPARPERAFERWLRADENLLVTIFGATEVSPQMVADEYLALSGLLTSGGVSRQELQGYLGQLLRDSALRTPYKTLTLFGGCARKKLEVGDERDALRSARNSGAIDERTYDVLLNLVGQSPEGRIQGFQQLLAPAPETAEVW